MINEANINLKSNINADIDYALKATFEKYPESVTLLGVDMAQQIMEGINIAKITRDGGARDRVRNATTDDFLKFFLDETIKAYNAATYFYFYDQKMVSLKTAAEKIEYLQKVFPCFSDLQKAINMMSNPRVNMVLYYKTHQNELLGLIQTIASLRFDPYYSYSDYVDKYGNGPTSLSNGRNENLFEKVEVDFARARIANSVKVNYRAVNRCLNDLLSGNQIKNQRNEYALEGTLFATQDIGKKRKNQEDTVVILQHPDNPDFKFLAVSDGMGGVAMGEKASVHMLQSISNWFNNLPVDAFYFPEELQSRFSAEISRISDEIYEKYNKDYNEIMAGATFTGAIVTSERTIIASVGDSRAYAARDGDLRLLTSDESVVWPRGISGLAISEEQLDDLRFDVRNNVIARCIGQPDCHYVKTFRIRNEDYDRLVLLSDGVTDLLSFEDIRIITNQSAPELVTKSLVDQAVSQDAIRFRGKDANHHAIINAGKDNASAVAVVRR